jgi:hypothetical protein
VSDLGELLELLQTAETRWRTVHATVRHEMDVELWARTMEHRAEGSGSLMVFAVTSGDREDDEAEPEIGGERVSEMWLERPNRWREEHGGRHRSTSVSNGTVCRVAYGAGDGFLVEHDADEDGFGVEAAWVFHPGRLAGAFAADTVEEVDHLGRPALHVVGTPAWRESEMEHMLGYGGDELELVVDRERGVVLRQETRVGGQMLSVTEILSVEFDEPLDPALFELEPDEGQTVRRFDEGTHPDLDPYVTLEQAIERATFEVWTPSRLPEIETEGPWDRWEPPFVSHIPVGEWNSTETVGLQYQGGSTDLRISESAAEGELSPGKALERIERGGRVLFVTDPGAQGKPRFLHPAQVILDLGGTRVTVYSQRLGADALVDVALSLVPGKPPAPSFED